MAECKRTVFITGASGLLGRVIYNEFCRHSNWQVIGTAFSRAQDKYLTLDLKNFEVVKKTITDHQPIHVIIHSAAERDCNKVDADYETAKKLNVEATQNLAELAATIGAKFIYISTDYVFDGKNPPYKETDAVCPLNKYGITKLEGEEASLKSHPGAIVLRVPLLYGPVEYLNESVATGLLNLFVDPKKKVEVSSYEIRFPTHVNDVAQVCYKLSKLGLKKPDEVKGIYHFTGPEAMTKYEMARIIAQELHLPLHHVVADTNPTKGAPRPFNSHLDTSKLENIMKIPKTRFEDSIAKCIANCALALGFQKKNV
ncbi:hypothetical protein CHUAL_004830 [Chamberlinius hualienensis]